MIFPSPIERLTWDNVEDQVGPHGPRWLHSQYWAGPQRCREWWMKTAVWSSPLPEDRSKWLRLCLHIWAEEIVGGGLGRYKQSHFHKTHTLGEKQNIGKIPMTLVRHVECVAIYYSLHTILWNWALSKLLQHNPTFSSVPKCSRSKAASRHCDLAPQCAKCLRRRTGSWNYIGQTAAASSSSEAQQQTPPNLCKTVFNISA